METAASGGPDIKAEFARRKKGRNVALVGLLVVLGVMLWVENAAIDTKLAIAILGVDIAAMLGFFVYQYRMWRCPACNRFLGVQTTSYGFGRELTSCPKCKAEFV